MISVKTADTEMIKYLLELITLLESIQNTTLDTINRQIIVVFLDIGVFCVICDIEVYNIPHLDLLVYVYLNGRAIDSVKRSGTCSRKARF